jgi:hypothetical protein
LNAQWIYSQLKKIIQNARLQVNHVYQNIVNKNNKILGIAFVIEKSWVDTKNKPDIKDDMPISGDNMKHIQWIYEKAKERAEKFGIKGVSLQLTKGVVKRIIPAIASTNAVRIKLKIGNCLSMYK